ncbi:MAG: hypothetical protein RL685_1751 [Pseudomonadota bacterium]|jgi:hypothetical protein
MRNLAELLGVLLVATLTGSGCTATPAVQTEVLPLSDSGADVASAPDALKANAPARLVFQVSARYPASLSYALDRAATVRGGAHDPRYRQWLFGAQPQTPSESLPRWFEAFVAQRSSWSATRNRGDGPYEPYAACSYAAETLTALLQCVEPLLGPSKLAIAQLALTEADVLLRPHWATLEPVLQRAQRELQAITSGPQGTELAELLARSAQLPMGKQLTFEVVLVARPQSNEARAHQSGSYLVVEVSEDLPANGRAPILFHELAHLAAQHAPGRPALESALRTRGTPGIVVGNLWNEAFATAFGNGQAAEQLNPKFAPEGSFYNNEAIDALGRALYGRWRAGTPVMLDASLSEQLLELLPTAWPRERWRMADVLTRMVLFSDKSELVKEVQQGLRSRSVHSYVPVPSQLSLPDSVPRPVPRLVLATLATLRARPEVLRAFGLSLSTTRTRVTKHGASLFWVEESQGPLLLVAAPTQASLLVASRTFASLQTVPEPGWTSLREQSAARPPG